MTDALCTDERTQAIALANRLLDEPNCDPDDELRVLSRQLLRRHEELERALGCLRNCSGKIYHPRMPNLVDALEKEIRKITGLS